VVPIGPRTGDVQGEIDLGRRELDCALFRRRRPSQPVVGGGRQCAAAPGMTSTVPGVSALGSLMTPRLAS
jgi:hypothetical protein